MAATSIIKLTSGRYTCPSAIPEVCTMLRRGRKPNCMACLVSEKTPEMMAWEAIMVAMVARATMG